MRRYRTLGDDSGHDYIVPVGQEGDFYAWVNAMEEGKNTDLDFEACRINNSGWTFADPQGWE